MIPLCESFSNINDTKYNIFVIIKPGFLNLSKDIIEIFEDNGWVVDRIRTKKLLPVEAKRLYKPHNKEDFFKDLCNYMCSDLSMGLLFVKDELMNEKKMFKETDAIKDKIREKWGESEMRNVLHSSDSLERLQIERGIYF